MRVKVAVLVSGFGSNLQALIDATHEEDYPGLIVLVISNRDEAYALTRARQADIPTRVLRHQDFADRISYDRALDGILQEHSVEFVCMAGFMRILSPWFTRKWAGRIINIHPSLLPAYKGLDTHARVLAAGEKRHGCSVHWVTEALDSGGIIAQLATDIRPSDTLESLKARVHKLEHQLYPEALRLALMERD
ncbi:MAG: phosphoribosylglycinamide formyltransferase [Alphaproteobacteria bacterium]|jgi:phosphoribosylglycinamide formyltransferase-1|nr:phosphoribosylglycinamide formyltransferase [Rickettsiales bacterium]